MVPPDDNVIVPDDAISRAPPPPPPPPPVDPRAAPPPPPPDPPISGSLRLLGTLRFFDNFYVDLHHFASNLAAATDTGEIKAACGGIVRAIEGPESPIIFASHGVVRMAPARGFSIYFP